MGRETKLHGKRTSGTPRILGVVNVTPDSFSDGGLFLDPERAAARAREQWDAGADWVDLGPASSHPSAPETSAEEEIRRLAPVLDRLRGRERQLSVDSFRPETQRYALARGIGMLNDVRGFPDPGLYPELAAADCLLVVMHAVAPGERAPAPEALVARIEHFFRARMDALEKAGVARERLVLDPGMGFFLSSDPRFSLAVLRALAALRERLAGPILIGVSRKGFLGELTGRAVAERGAATLAAELFAAAQGADFIRTHDVRALRDALRVHDALREGSA
jgi:dihydropteroate synthase type 2